MTLDGRPPPAHIQLGAKWVEVRKRRDRRERNSEMKSEFETWPATPVTGRLNQRILLCVEASRSCSSNRRSSRGRPAIHKAKSETSQTGKPPAGVQDPTSDHWSL